MVTPMRGDGELDFPALKRFVAWQMAQGINGLVVAGTTGESATLSQDEFARLLEAVVTQVDGQLPVIAGTGSASTADAVKKTRLAASLGADAALVVTPYYNRPTQSGLSAHYRAVADGCDLPVILYNVPTRTGVDLLPETVVALAEVSTIVAIKEAVADEDRVRDLLACLQGKLSVLSGDDASAARSIELGAAGVISVVSNFAPAAMQAMCAATDVAKRQALDAKLQPLYAASMIEPNPIPAKWSLYRMGMMDNVLRLPLQPLSAAGEAQLRPLIDGLQQ